MPMAQAMYAPRHPHPAPRPCPPPGAVTDCEGRTVTVVYHTVCERVACRDIGLAVIYIEGKGKGLFTRGKGVPAGGVVLQETGVVITADERVRPERLLERGEVMARISELEAHGVDVATPDGVMEVLNTNAFVLPAAMGGREAPGSPSSGIFPLVARANHSCVPNAVVALARTSEGGAVATLRALTAIPAHTEVSISYGRIQHGWDTASRRAGLLEAKKFFCKCPACALGYDPMVGGPPVLLPVLMAHMTAARGAQAAEKKSSPPLEWKANQRIDPKLLQKLYTFVLSHGDETANNKRSLEEYVAGVHVVGRLVGYRHWGVAYVCRGLLLNAAAAAEPQNGRAWREVVAHLLRYYRAWGAHVFADGRDAQSEAEQEPVQPPPALALHSYDTRCSDWFVELLFHSARVLEAGGAHEHGHLVTACYALIYGSHVRLFGTEHADSKAMAARLATAETSGECVGPTSFATDFAFTEDNMQLCSGVAAADIVAKHRDRLLLTKFPGLRPVA